MAPKDKAAADDVVIDEEAPGAPISVPDTGENSEGGKLKMIVALVKKAFGVKDIASMRLSLPASLMEPVPNLEYWGYLDRPDMFASINDSVDPFVRMLAAVRFAFTKDIKFIHGRIVKPYNSVLGEHFRAHWDVPSATYDDAGTIICHINTTTASEPTAVVTKINGDTESIKSARSSKSAAPSPGGSSVQDGAATDLSAGISNLNLGDGEELVRVVYLTEQVSHHPPVSSYYAYAPSRHVEMVGVDQISSKISGTTLRVAPGVFNKGIYVNLTGGFGEGESYHITHPVASVNGLLRGSFYVTVGDTCVITQTGHKDGQNLRAVLEYKEEGWISKARYLVEGVIHTYKDGETEHEQWLKVKQVPQSRVVAQIDGSWRGEIRWKRSGHGTFPASASSSPTPSIAALSVPAGGRSAMSSRLNLNLDSGWQTLLDCTTLRQVPKIVRPLEEQDSYESRNLWGSVTKHLVAKEFSAATNEKIAIEQKQRDIAAERKRKGETFVPAYFEEDISDGRPKLTAAGRKAVEEETGYPASYKLEGINTATAAVDVEGLPQTAKPAAVPETLAVQTA